MRAVSDADVIIHLSKLDKLSLLQSLYTEIAIPEYVKSEILSKDSPQIQKAILSFIKIFKISKDKAGNIARKHGIHIGEGHVKALGEELKSSLFLSNERKVRKAAKEEGFAVAGTIGVILRAVKKGLLSKVEAISLLKKMKSQDFRIHPDILQRAINSVEKI
jgi:predicted nucleic acid-binding protein